MTGETPRQKAIQPLTVEEAIAALGSADHVVLAANLGGLNYAGRPLPPESTRVVVSLDHLRVGAVAGDQRRSGRFQVERIVESIAGAKSLTFLDIPLSARVITTLARRSPDLRHLALSPGTTGDNGARAIAEHLSDLTSLELWANQIGAEGAQAIAEHLSSLRSLDLRYNHIGDDGARAIAKHLSSLKSLGLWGTQIGDDGARAIAEQLGNLTSLGLGNNRIGDDGARAIAKHLGNLTSLGLGGNQIGDDGTRAIAEHLSDLMSLDLERNPIGDGGARAIAEHLSSLKSLGLGYNHIGDDGARAIAKHLSSLKSLGLWGTQIGDDGARAIAEQLGNLSSLGLGNNRIGDDGARAIAKHLGNLASLGLGGNQIGGDGLRALLTAASSDQGSRLDTLDLTGNPGLEELGLAEVGLAEVGGSTSAAVLIEAFRARYGSDARPREPFNEIKMVVLGNEAVGKTSLVAALIDRRAAEQHGPTLGANHGILQTQWEGHAAAALNVWDFGGQEIQHQTHNYFLTERCIFVIVLSNRTHNDKSVYEWLTTASKRSPNSPVVVVVNKCDHGRRDIEIDFRQLKRQHREITGVFNVSCLPQNGLTLRSTSYPNKSLNPLRQHLDDIANTHSSLEPARVPVPRSWIGIRDQLRELAGEQQVVEAHEYSQLCEQFAIQDDAERVALLLRLQLAGVVVAHGLGPDTARVDRLTLLEPNWLTYAVYALLGPGNTEAVFDRDRLRRLVHAERSRAQLYGDMRLDYVIDLLQGEALKLAYRLPGQDMPPRFLLPSKLPIEAPVGVKGGWDPASLRFRFRYNTLPAGLIPRFQVTGHQYFGGNPNQWRSGCTMEVNGCPVLVYAHPDRPIVDVLVAGDTANRRDALATVRATLAIVHDEIPECGAEERVPLPGDPEIDVSYDWLANLWVATPDAAVRPDKARREYTPRELLDGIEPDGQRSQGPPVVVNVGNSPGAVVRVGPGDTSVTNASPEPPPDPVGARANRITVDVAIGALLGLVGSALYLAGKGAGFPLDQLAAGPLFGTVMGGAVGLVRAKVSRRQDSNRALGH